MKKIFTAILKPFFFIAAIAYIGLEKLAEYLSPDEEDEFYE